MSKKVYEQPRVGDKFGRLEILKIFVEKKEKQGSKNQYKKMALCQCECGNEKIFTLYLLRIGKTKSCGCYNREAASQRLKLRRIKYEYNVTHYHLSKRFYKIYSRCYKESDSQYYNYGARGIVLCDIWNPNIVGMYQATKSFIEWALGNGYEKNLQIDRKDNNGPYSPENCRWVTPAVNCRNKRTSVFYTYENETRNLKDWANDERCVVSLDCLRKRLSKGIDLITAMTTRGKQKQSFYRQER